MYSQISILRNHIYLAVDFGANFQELCKRLNMSPDYLNNGEGHAQWQPGSENDFWMQALEMTGVPSLGLQMGQRSSNQPAFGMLGMLATSCRNIREGMEMICKYNDTLTSVFKFSFHVGEKEAAFIFDPLPLWEESCLESARQAVDMFLSGVIKAFQDATGKKIYPLRTEIRYSSRFEEEYKKILPTPISFDQKHNRLVFSKEFINTPLLSYDESQYAIFSAVLHQKQKNFEREQSLSERIRHLLVSKFNGQITHIDLIASHLCMTTRTLQRKLTEEQTSYRKICHELRKELVDDLVKIGKTKSGELASLFGYADVNAFKRALK